MYASVIPLAICFLGIERITSGSKIEKTGKSPGPPIANFCLVALLEITEPEFISEPVAGKVSTEAKGSPFPSSVLIPFCKMSQGSPSYLAAAERNFTPSITEPPPTASI